MKLTENAMTLRKLARVEAVANVEEILLRRTEFTGADGAAQDKNGEEETEACDLTMAEKSLEFSSPLRSYTFF